MNLSRKDVAIRGVYGIKFSRDKNRSSPHLFLVRGGGLEGVIYVVTKAA